MADAADRGWVCKGESVLSPRTVFFAKTEQARSPALSRLHASRHDSAGPGLSQQRIAATAPPPSIHAGRARQVAVAGAAGRVSAETVLSYPPGIPSLLPGQRVTPHAVARLGAAGRETLRVVAHCEAPPDSCGVAGEP